MSWLIEAIRAKLVAEQQALDAELLALALNPPPERIVRCSLIPRHTAYAIPGDKFTDGLDRLVVHPRDRLADATLQRYGMLDA